MIVVSHCVVSGDGRSEKHWQGVLRRVGGKVDGPDAPFFVDQMPVKKKGEPLTLASMPHLATAVGSVVRFQGATLLEPNFGHLVSVTVWNQIAPILHASHSRVRCAETGQVVEGGTLDEFTAAGAALLRNALARGKGKSMAEAKRGVPFKNRGGLPRKKPQGQKLNQALEMFVDLENWSVPTIAQHMGMSISTLLRAIKDRTGTQSRSEAYRLAQRGLWPLKSKPKGKSNLALPAPQSE